MHAATEMNTAIEQKMELRDPQTGRIWSAPKRFMIHEVDASVKQRLLANFFVPRKVLSSLGVPSFLEPVPFRDGCAHLSVCIIDMKCAAPTWAPTALAPPCVGAALRVTCRDVRDGSSAVFVDTRFTNSFLTPMLGFLGLGGFNDGLQVLGSLGDEGAVSSDRWSLEVTERSASEDAPNFSSDVFNALVASGVASYDCAGRRADLVKRGHGSFARREARSTRLFWEGAIYEGDLRVSTGGAYRWSWR